MAAATESTAKSAALKEIQQQLSGTWILHRSENVDEYLKELGVGCCERKSIQNNILTQIIYVTDDVIHLEMEVGKRHVQLAFKLEEEFEIDAGKRSKATASWQDNTLTLRIRRMHCQRQQIVERRREGGLLVQTMRANNVICRRYLKLKT